MVGFCHGGNMLGNHGADGDDGDADGDDFKQFTKRRTMLSSWSTLVTINTQLSSATPGKSQQIEFVTNIKNDRNK